MIFFDTETTDLIRNSALPLNMQPRIVEIGAVKDNGDELCLLINPKIPLPEKTKEITGLKDEDLVTAPTFATVYEQLVDFFIGEKTLICHNLPFDLGMLTIELRRINKEFSFPYPPQQVCTVQMARPAYKGKFMRLQALYEDLIGPYEQKHRALQDALDLQRVYHELRLKGLQHAGA